MKTTLNIDDSVMERLREEAARRNTTMSKLVEAGIRRILDEPKNSQEQVREQRPTWNSGGARVDISNSDALQDFMAEQ
ncbi:MAG: ribbon-helix-helix protein, CopG family [Pseudomonadota bacterium]